MVTRKDTHAQRLPETTNRKTTKTEKVLATELQNTYRIHSANTADTICADLNAYCAVA